MPSISPNSSLVSVGEKEIKREEEIKMEQQDNREIKLKKEKKNI